MAVERPQSNTTNIFKHYSLEHEPQIQVPNWWISLRAVLVGFSLRIPTTSYLYQTATTTSE